MELNNAVILPEIEPLSFEVGGMEAIGSNVILFPDSDLKEFLPEFETQSNTYFDTWGCVSHSFENALEALITRQDFENNEWLLKNIYKQGRPNFSDRDLVVLSGTKPSVGNSGNQVLARAKQNGLISQDFEDWDNKSRDPKNTVELYYAYARTPEAEVKAKEFNDRFEIVGTWVQRDNIEEAMKTGAVQVYVNAWHKNNDGKYYNPTGNHNHAVLACGYKYKEIYDTYNPRIKQLSSWNDIYSWALKINIIEKTMSKPNIKQNSLVMLVEGSGGIGLFLDDKIIEDDTAKILAVYIARNASGGEFNNAPVVSLTQAQWDLFDKRKL